MSAGRNVAAALAYAGRLGWPVFPLAGKVPAIRGGRGYLDATTDAETIRAYWERYPRANIGVSCIGGGFFALDVDPRHGGDRTLAEMEEKYGPLPVTVRQRTGGDGQHILLSETRDVHFRGSIGPGIDVRYRGGLVVAPSIHPETGQQYRWATGYHPLETSIAHPPAWLLALLVLNEPTPVGHARPAIDETTGWGPKPRYSRSALQRACEAIERAPVGEQQRTLNREAYSIGRLIGAGLMPRQLAVDCLCFHATMMSNAPGRRRWQERELIQKVTQAVRDGERHPREVPA